MNTQQHNPHTELFTQNRDSPHTYPASPWSSRTHTEHVSSKENHTDSNNSSLQLFIQERASCMFSTLTLYEQWGASHAALFYKLKLCRSLLVAFDQTIVKMRQKQLYVGNRHTSWWQAPLFPFWLQSYKYDKRVSSSFRVTLKSWFKLLVDIYNVESAYLVIDDLFNTSKP